MAYQYSNAAREIKAVEKISTRSLLLVLASAVDVKTGSCFHSAGCLMYWSGLSKGTFYAAVEELENLGILKRERRRKGNRTNLWILNIARMEDLRVSWQDVKPTDAPDTQEVTDDSGMGLPQDEEEIDEAEIGMWASEMNSKYKIQPGTDDYWTLSKVLDILGTHSVSFARFKQVVEGLNRVAQEGRLHLFYPSVEAGKTGHLSHKAFMGPVKFPDRAKAWDRVEKSVNETNFDAIYAEE
jgi:hypothetical protein